MSDTTTPSGVRKYLTFTLDGELFGMDVVRVREVVEFTPIIQVLHAPEFIRGVMNLRGRVLPVMDLRLHFGMAAIEEKGEGCVIIAELMVAGKAILVGIFADAVRDVVDVPPDKVEPGPRIGTRLNSDFIRSWARRMITS